MSDYTVNSDDDSVAWRNARLTEWANKRLLDPSHQEWRRDVQRQIDSGTPDEGLDAEGVRKLFGEPR